MSDDEFETIAQKIELRCYGPAECDALVSECRRLRAPHPAVEVLDALEARLKASADIGSKPAPAFWLGWIEEARRAKDV